MSKSYKGVPVKDREPAHIKDALRNKPLVVVEKFLALHQYARKNDVGITQLYHRTGISTGILSQCFNGDYNGDYHAISERIDKFFWRLEQKDLYGGIRKFVRTRLSNILFNIFEKTRVIRRIQFIQSPEQLGKSRSAVEYTQQNNSGRTVYVKLSGGTRNGCGDFIWMLAETLNIPISIKMREKRARIRHALEACDLVIIDEAHLVWAWTDRAIKDFFDYIRTDIYSDGARGVVLISTNSDMMTGIKRLKTRTAYNVGQLLGRTRNEVMTIDPAEDIVREDVTALISRYYKPSATVTTKLLHVARQEMLGHFGLLEDIMNEAWTRAKAAKKKLDDKTVLSTAGQIMDELKGRKDLYQ